MHYHFARNRDYLDEGDCYATFGLKRVSFTAHIDRCYPLIRPCLFVHVLYIVITKTLVVILLFTDMKLCLATATHNFKWVIIHS